MYLVGDSVDPHFTHRCSRVRLADNDMVKDFDFEKLPRTASSQLRGSMFPCLLHPSHRPFAGLNLEVFRACASLRDENRC